jgi:signal-transduction protein with cAMP-binding, CBS, and nucleotidyltransferase domain
METEVRIREVMSRALVTSSPESSVEDVARAMAESQIGSVIITENGFNEGIVTERDICYKVVAEGLDPKKVAAKDIMTTDLVTVESDRTITEAAKVMVKKGIRRLAIVEKGKVIGILTASDILAVSPKTIEVLRELYEIYSSPEEALAEPSEGLTEGGTCDECAVFTDNLKMVNGRYLCDDCREELEG